jgi:5-methylcytosine-specific restriction endonuclease McrA
MARGTAVGEDGGVQRAVWARDEGKCQSRLDSGGICGSALRLGIDHIRPLARGGQSTVANCRLACRFHNQLAARQVYGDEWMNRLTGDPESTVPVAREAAAPWNLRPPSRRAADPRPGWLDRPPAALARGCERC